MFIGKLEVITGSMFSGKSEELIRRMRRANYAKQKLLVFSPSIDNRYGINGIYSHNKNNFSAYSVNSIEQMENILIDNPDVEVIGIDEIQFLPKGVVDFCKRCVDLGKRVIVAGLDQDFRTMPFEPLPELMAIADDVSKLKAICMVCGEPAYASQRLIDGMPAFDDDPLVAVGSTENYEARCRMHHIVRKRSDVQIPIEFLISLNKEVRIPNKFESYKLIKLDIKKKVSEIRNEIRMERSKVQKLAVLIDKSISHRIEGNYSVIDLLREMVKISNVSALSTSDSETQEDLLTLNELLERCDLKLSSVYMEEKADKIKKIGKKLNINIESIGE